MNELLAIDIHCDICGRNWELRDATMPQAELMFKLSESHVHTDDQLAMYMNSEPDYSMHYDDQTDTQDED
ncbi:hypothetical protein [Glutamicibacter ardleyensis]|uniref:Uncharacterized protein n=1 Tax=Glutamicibacter ardleyensis TaxID=225894 RepID=A0ABQ2DFV7_9MICC|nr:hypothetical protein [Glutamicibacter ardleyensis]GGJ55760.1 hypothetical protein GCM10007173_13250 [Glutamicibacter ardleyensis]